MNYSKYYYLFASNFVLMCANKQDQKDIKYQVDNLSTVSDIKTSVTLHNIDTVNEVQEAIMQIRCSNSQQPSNVISNDVWLNLSKSTLLQQKISRLANTVNNFIKKHFEGKYDEVLKFDDEKFKNVIYEHFDSLGMITIYFDSLGRIIICKDKDEFVKKFSDDEKYKNNICINLKIAVSIAKQVWSQYNKDPKTTNGENDAQKELNSILTNSYGEFSDEFLVFCVLMLIP